MGTLLTRIEVIGLNFDTATPIAAIYPIFNSYYITKRVAIDPNQIFKEELYPHHVALFRYALALCKNDETSAKDLVQDTYLKAYNALENYRAGTKARAWLFVIQRNLFVNKYRQGKKAKMVSLDAPDELFTTPEGAVSQPGGLNGYSEELVYTMSDVVYSALQSLDQKYKEVLILADLEDFKYEEIAEITGTPIGTVRSRLNRGRTMLRDKLREYGKAQGFIS